MPRLFVGLMSGTSLDGVDAVLADLSDHSHFKWISHTHIPFDRELKQCLLDLHQSGPNELHRSQLAGLQLASLYAQAVQQLLSQKQLQPKDIEAIGAHGQTIRHCPQIDGQVGYTLQLNQPALLAELSGIGVVADFRSRDIAAGGQGAPLVPAFHQALWGDPDRPVAALNIGGIANLSLMNPGKQLLGFDCGPGNMLMDAWIQQHLSQPYDADGRWASQGQVNPALLHRMLAEPYFSRPAPKSTGRDLFDLAWLQKHLSSLAPLDPVDVQSTLLELTALTCTQALRQNLPNAAQLIVCGGGAYNQVLMQRLEQLAQCPVQTSAARGLDPNWVEAAAFAWLAQRAMDRRAGNEPSVTGAQGHRVLGAIYPA